MKTPLSELLKLNPLVGKWQSSGTVLSSDSTPEMKISGTDSYEWVCDGTFLLHRVYVTMGEEKTEVIEMIGYDPEAKNYPMRSFDNHGDFTVMHFSVDEKGVWTIKGDKVRSTCINPRNPLIRLIGDSDKFNPRNPIIRLIRDSDYELCRLIVFSGPIRQNETIMSFAFFINGSS
jgi:hypothetical protein